MRATDNSEEQKYIESLFKNESDSKKQAREFSVELGLERISLSPLEGNIIKLLVSLHRPQKIVEIGTLTGLSALYILDAMRDSSQLWTLEKNPEHVKRAQQVFNSANISSAKVEIIEGDARETLKELSGKGPFDMVFIDGNKAAYEDYLDWSVANLRAGGVIVADNIFLSGTVWGEEGVQKFSPKQIKIMQNFNRRLADSDQFESAVLPTYEGLFVAIKK